MAWKMSGTYVASCSCRLICPCSIDEPPIGPGDECRMVSVFSITDGSRDDTDLSSVNFAFCTMFASKPSSGDWTVGVIVDGDASDEQVGALERILRGEEGGFFGLLGAAVYGDWLGVERGSVTFSDGDRPSASVRDVSFTFEPFEGPGGTHTTVRNAMFGYSNGEHRIGKTPAHSDLFGMEFDAIYGETGDFEFAGEVSEA